MGVFLGASTKIVDRETGEVFVGEVPEYSVLVPGNLPEAAQAAQRIMAQVAEAFEAGSGPKIDLSMGCAAAPTHGDELSELLEAADVALLDAKRAGRSRAMIAGAELRGDDHLAA